MEKILQSSDGSGNLSITIKGLLLGLVPLVISLLSSQGYSVAENDLVSFIEKVFIIASAVTFIMGLVKKAYYATRKQ